ncbi:MAG: hypothetical protein IKA86_06025 [Paraprevotella sp.]|nr:hypothetical protein [Paraprevotella sp.]
MKQIDNINKAKVKNPMLDFLSGNVNTSAAKRLTRSVCSMLSLWQLAKMSRIVNKNTED